jgi:hypothetical protein
MLYCYTWWFISNHQEEEGIQSPSVILYHVDEMVGSSYEAEMYYQRRIIEDS